MINLIKRLFRSKSLREKLDEKYKKTLHEAFTLSKVNRTASDAKYAEALRIADQIEALTGAEAE
jgi:hypothetical protein